MKPQLFNPEIIEHRIESKQIGEAVISSRPKVSIVIPAYNVADFICETLNSVFSQTFKDYEILVINDGSPDSVNLEKTLTPFFKQIIYVKQPNGGAASARNTAIFLARGELLAFLDGDDIWESKYLEMQVSKLEKNNFDLIYADAMMFGLKPWAGKTFMQLSPSKGEVTLEKLLLAECNIITSGTVVKRDVVLKSGGFDEDKIVFGCEDFDLWVRIAKKRFRIGYQKDVLLNYRVVAGSLSGGYVDRAERSLQVLLIAKNKVKLDEREENAIEKQILIAKAQLNLEKGKTCLVEGKFFEAQEFFRQSNKFFYKKKLTIIITLLNVCPKLVLYLFRSFRSDEVSFVNIGKKH